jgi:methyl-accepting chemotaxis protein
MPSRVSSKLGWSVGVVYPENDIFGDYNSLLYYVLAIAIVGLVLMYLLSYLVIKSRLKPLLMLTAKAQHIAEGNFNEPIPDSRHIDEVGRLQDNFQIMQRSLAVQVGELDHLKATLYKRCDDLHEAYNEAKQADRMKTSFLHNMTNQMMAPAEAIEKSVSLLCKSSDCDAPSLISDIQKNGKAITVLLKNLISMSDDDMRKEGHND